jgi:hypothetical protein
MRKGKMTISVAPHARYMILCDEVLPDPQRPGKLMIVGLTSLVDWPADGTAPLLLEKLVVLLVLTDGRGVGTGQIVCRNEVSGAAVFGSPPTRITFEGREPTGHYAVTFKLLDCRFREPGAYVVQFLFDDTLVQEQPLTVR